MTIREIIQVIGQLGLSEKGIIVAMLLALGTLIMLAVINIRKPREPDSQSKKQTDKSSTTLTITFNRSKE